MVHGVAGGRFALYSLEVNLELFGNEGQLLGCGTQSHEAGVKVFNISFEQFCSVALRIDRDKYRLQFVTVSAQQTFHFSQLLHGSGAHIGALGIAKENHHQLAREIFDFSDLSILVGQVEFFGVIGTRDVNAFEGGFGFGAAGQGQHRCSHRAQC